MGFPVLHRHPSAPNSDGAHAVSSLADIITAVNSQNLKPAVGRQSRRERIRRSIIGKGTFVDEVTIHVITGTLSGLLVFEKRSDIEGAARTVRDLISRTDKIDAIPVIVVVSPLAPIVSSIRP